MPTAQTGSVTSGDTVAVILNTKVPTLGNNNPTTGEYEYAGYAFNGWCTVQPEEDQTTGYQTCPNDATLYQPGDNFGIDQTAENTQILYATWGAPARVTFNSNGLIYNNTQGNITNTVEYIPTHEGNKITGQRQNMVYTGIYNTPAYEETTPTTNYILKGWSEDSTATEATYKDEQEIIENLNLTADNDITLYAVWTYTTVITFNGNGNDAGNTPMVDIIIEAGQTEALPQNTYTKDGYIFTGWNTVQTPTEQDPGETYADKVNYTAGTESNTITLYAMWTDCQSGRICYDDNGANSVTKMGDQTANYSDNTDAITSNMAVNLFPSNFKYDTNNDGQSDYGFAGWSEDKNAATAINATNNKPTIYGPMQNITTGDLSVNGLKLYAVWVPVAKDKDGNELTFQTEGLLTTQLTETAGDTLANKPNKYITALRDERDNQVYAVAKLKDGNYWMIENLRLNNNSTTPNWGDNSLSQGFGGVFSGLANAESENFSSSTTANSLYSTGNAYTMPRYNNNNTNSPVANMTGADGDIYSYGNYYTWAAAIANTTAYGSSSDVINTSICPAGWHLPYGGSGTSTNGGNTSGGFYNLNYKINNNRNVTDATAGRNLRAYPNNFVYSGVFDNSSARGRGRRGGYWSSTAGDSSGAYILNFNSSRVTPGTGLSSKYKGGLSVRCVLGS